MLNTQEKISLKLLKSLLPICENFDSEDLPKAMDYLETGSPKFRIVINVRDYAKKHGLHTLL